MKLEIKYIPIESIKPYENNPKIHSREQIEAIKESVNKLGNRKPIEIDENNIIICGHGRLEAYQIIGLKEVPVIIHSDMTENQKKAYRIADNELASRSEWDFKALNIEIKDLDFEIKNLLDFKEIEIDKSPIQNNKLYTDREIEKEAMDIANKMIKEKKAYNIICPGCGNEFTIR